MPWCTNRFIKSEGTIKLWKINFYSIDIGTVKVLYYIGILN